ncbi:hypothetical protein L9F63_025073, partial [Diploptera punctata]
PLHFLDLADIDEKERSYLHKILFTRDPAKVDEYPELPWSDMTYSPLEWTAASYASQEPTDSSVNLDGDDSATQNASSPIAQEIVPEETHSAAAVIHTPSSVYPETPVVTLPHQIPTSVPAQPPGMYQVSHVPMSGLYVSNVANVSLHGYVSNPYSTYQQISPHPVYTGEVTHEPTTTSARNGRDSRRMNSKRNNKRIENQFNDRSSAGRHSQDILPTQSPQLDSPPTVNSSIAPQNYAMYSQISPMHHGYATQFFNPATPSHLAAHHPNPQHGTPIYIPSHPSMYTPMYSSYTHQAGAPPMMAFPTIPSGAVVTTGNSMETSGPEETTVAVTNKEVLLNEVSIHQSQKQVITYHSEPIQEMCEVVTEQNNAKSIGYQQQQSEDDDYSQSNLVKTVVVSNSNIVSEPVSFIDVTQSETKNRNLPPPSVHQHLSKDAVPSSFVPEKALNSETLVHNSVQMTQSSRVNVSDTSLCVNTVVSDLNSKQEKTIVNAVTLPSVVAQHDMSQLEIKSSCGVDVPVPSSTENIVAYTECVSNSGDVQHQTSGQNVIASHTVDVSAAQASTPAPSNSKSWASLFKSAASSPGESMMSGAPSGIKLSANMKPFQNAVPATGDLSRRVSEGHAAPVSTTANIVSGRSFPNTPTTPIEDPYLYRLGEFLSKYQLEHKTLSLQPRGLTNRSNWCYINSTLQALLACPQFYNLMKDLKKPLETRRTTKSTTPIIDSMVQFVSEFLPLSAASRPRDRKEKAVRKDDGSIEDQCGPPFEPNYIYKMLNSIRSDTFKVEGRQEDAEEFLGCLLNALNDEMLE